MSIVLNLFGAPGAGKSTAASFIFSLLKQSGISAELASEVAKEKVWEQNDMALSAQDYLFGCQHYKLRQLAGKVDVIITDSPLLLTLFYTENDPTLGKPFDDLVRHAFACYENLNFFLYRTKPYMRAGRLQTEEESDRIAFRLMDFLHQSKIDFDIVPGSMQGFYDIVKKVSLVLRQKEGIS